MLLPLQELMWRQVRLARLAAVAQVDSPDRLAHLAPWPAYAVEGGSELVYRAVHEDRPLLAHRVCGLFPPAGTLRALPDFWRMALNPHVLRLRGVCYEHSWPGCKWPLLSRVSSSHRAALRGAPLLQTPAAALFPRQRRFEVQVHGFRRAGHRRAAGLVVCGAAQLGAVGHPLRPDGLPVPGPDAHPREPVGAVS